MLLIRFFVNASQDIKKPLPGFHRGAAFRIQGINTCRLRASEVSAAPAP